MLPRAGVDATYLAAELDMMVANAWNNSRDANTYVAWIHSLELSLRAYFSDVPVDRLCTDRFWHISSGGGARPEEMIRQEMQTQVDWLTALATSVKTMRSRLSDPPSTIGVLDTNVVLHHKPLHHVDWSKVIDAETVRLVLPLRVVDELDDQKASPRKELSRRAATRIRQLEGYLAGDGPHEVRPGVAIEVVGLFEFDPGLSRRPLLPPDVEILDTCQAVVAYAGPNPVYLVTGDRGMKIRAGASGLPLREMPEADRQPLGEEEEG